LLEKGHIFTNILTNGGKDEELLRGREKIGRLTKSLNYQGIINK
jgi:hypothetical protein